MKAEDWLVDFAATLKKELVSDFSKQTAEQVAAKINARNLTEKLTKTDSRKCMQRRYGISSRLKTQAHIMMP